MLAALSQLLTTELIVALVTLTVMEIIPGIDNIVFIAIVTARLPEKQRPTARRIGLTLAMVSRIALLMAIGWLLTLGASLFHLSDLVPTLGIAEWWEANDETRQSRC